ncbi:MAG TPA: 16S rRNA (adenine(1518)-N(6)/adenine(1519)-N(6))-dimethyltransferase RsmA [Candidatus Paceibacterota bacterium]
MRQKLGQHFLKNKDVLEALVKTLKVQEWDILIEIGAGHGELTDVYIGKKNKLFLLERDRELVTRLKEKYRHFKNVKVIEGDAVKTFPEIMKKTIKNKKYKLFGNIPYYITGALFRKISELKNKPQIAALLIQKEVALRVTASPPKMNLLAASVQVWAKTEVVRDVSRFDFSPSPEIDSSILVLSPLHKVSITAGYYAFIRRLFKQPKKTVLNNLREGLKGIKDEVIKHLLSSGIEPNTRPQNLNIKQIDNLSKEPLFLEEKS